MRRNMFAVFGSIFAVVLATHTVHSAPKPKDSDKPEAPATPEQRERSENNLKQFGLALHNYHDTNGALPTNYLTKDGKPGLSWRVAILPYLEADQVYKQFKLDEPWDSEHNLKLVEQMPKFYAPVRGKTEKHQTFYQMFAGKQTMLAPPGKAISLAAVTDGLSNTLMIVEAAKPVIWTKPDDIPFDGESVPKLGGSFDGEFHAVMGDGAVIRVPKGIDSPILLLAIDRADGKAIDLRDAIRRAKE